MALPDIFSEDVVNDFIDRINRLTPNAERRWGKMSVDQMLAHCCVTYEMVYEPGKHPLPNLLMGLLLKTIVKRIVVNEKPFKKNNPTGPQFIMTGNKDFEAEKSRLIEFIYKTQRLGRVEFEGKKSDSFGKLTATEWNNMFYKHLDHHLTQFGV